MSPSNTIALVFKDGNKNVAVAFDASKPIPLEDLTTPTPAGPFLLQAEVVSPTQGEALSEKVDILAAIAGDTIHVFMRELPVLAKYAPKFSIRDGLRFAMTEPCNNGTEALTSISAKQMISGARPKVNSAWYYFSFTAKSSNCWCSIWVDDDQTLWSIPFYNFHNNGHVCAGDSGADRGSAFKKLIALLNSYTTPHNTFNVSGDYSLIPPKSVDDTKPSQTGSEAAKTKTLKWMKKNIDKFQFAFKKSADTFAAPRDLTKVLAPPDCLTNAKVRNKPIGKLLPMI